MSDMEAREVVDETFTEKPILWHVQYCDESRDCDGTYPLTPHYVMARCEDDAENRADEDFDTFEGVSAIGPFAVRPATDGEVQAWMVVSGLVVTTAVADRRVADMQERAAGVADHLQSGLTAIGEWDQAEGATRCLDAIRALPLRRYGPTKSDTK